MGNTVRSLGMFKTPEQKILVLGLDASGKTTMLYKMRLGEVVHTIPTIGMNVESVQYKHINFTSLDVGGRDKIRALWRHFYQESKALVFLVDSNDLDRMDEVRDELERALGEEPLRQVPLLVMANKQDLPKALTATEISERLGLSRLAGDRPWHIQPTCATSGDGLYEGFDWLSGVLTGKKSAATAEPPSSAKSAASSTAEETTGGTDSRTLKEARTGWLHALEKKAFLQSKFWISLL